MPLGIAAAAVALAAAVAVGRGPDPRRRVARGSQLSRFGSVGSVGVLASTVGSRLMARSRRRRANDAELLRGVVAGWAAELRGGRPAGPALAAAIAASPHGAEAFARTSAALDVGADVEAALRADAHGVDPQAAQALRALAACWAVGDRHGARLVDALDRVVASMSASIEHAAAVRAELAGPRATARLLAVLPLFALVMSAGLGIDAWQVLLSDPVGRMCLVAGVTLDLGGLFWSARIAGAAERGE